MRLRFRAELSEQAGAAGDMPMREEEHKNAMGSFIDDRVLLVNS